MKSAFYAKISFPRGETALLALVLSLTPLALSGCDSTKSRYNDAVRAYGSMDFDSAKAQFASLPDGYAFAPDYLAAIAAESACANQDWLAALRNFNTLSQNAQDRHINIASNSSKAEITAHEQEINDARTYYNNLLVPLSKKMEADNAVPSGYASFTFTPLTDKDRVGFDTIERSWGPLTENTLYQYYVSQFAQGADLSALAEFPLPVHPFANTLGSPQSLTAEEKDNLTLWRDRCGDWIRYRTQLLAKSDAAGASPTGAGLYMDDTSNIGNGDDLVSPNDFAAVLSPFFFRRSGGEQALPPMFRENLRLLRHLYGQLQKLYLHHHRHHYRCRHREAPVYRQLHDLSAFRQMVGLGLLRSFRH